MKQARDLKAELQAGTAVFGCWLGLNSPAVAEIVAAAGFDFVLIDLEHGPGDPEEARAAMQAISAYPCAPLVRVPANDPLCIKRCLDLGALGVMVPSIETAEEAERAVAASRYPPRGRRGMAPTVVRASGYGARWREYVAEIDARLLVIGQIESRNGLDNLDSIAAVEGLDMLFVGPFDLSGGLGFPAQPDHPEVKAAAARVEAAAKAAGKLVGTIPTPERSVEALLAAGNRFIAAASDVALVREAAVAARTALAAAAARR